MSTSSEVVRREQARRFPAVVVVVVLLAMFVEALGITAAGAAVRNVAAGAMALVFLAAVMKHPRMEGGSALPIALLAFGSWVCLRVLYDSGLSLTPLLLVLWFPFTFFVAYTSRARISSSSKIVTGFVVMSSIFYLSVALGEGVRGAQAINAVFYVVMGLPFVLASPHVPLRLMGLAGIVFATAASDKRTAVIVLVLGLAAHAVAAWASSKRLESKRRNGSVGALGILVVAGYWVSARQFDIDVLEKFARISEDEGSGRVEIYQWVLHQLALKDLSSLVLGAGQDGVAKAAGGLSAHNDFLEIAYDFGLIGLGFFLILYVALLSALFRLIAAGSPLAGPWAAAIAVFTTMTALSHVVFVPTYVALLTFFWGLATRELNEESRADIDKANSKGIADDRK